MAPIQELVEQLKDPEPFKRREAVLMLRDLGPEAREALPALRKATNDPDWYVAKLAAVALSYIESEVQKH
jgi:HEAT repeat protein